MLHQHNIVKAGTPLEEAKKVLIMVHGRSGSANDIITLAAHLNIPEFAILAPQATGNTWYPQSFLAPPAQNEPYLTAALEALTQVVDEVVAMGISRENIYFLGFSQGACLTLEFTARNAGKYGGIIAFTGGLIGDQVYTDNYKGNFNQTPVYIGSSDPDFHVPVTRVHESAAVFQSMGASVTATIYPNMGHTITAEEINQANRLVFK